MEKERGGIAEGFQADIVATPGNPYEDVDTLRRVGFVIKDGRVIRND